MFSSNSLAYFAICYVFAFTDGKGCLHPGKRLHANVTMSKEEVGGVYPVDTIATYNCDTGFELLNNKIRRCLPDGTWSEIEPYCGINVVNSSVVKSVFPDDNDEYWPSRHVAIGDCMWINKPKAKWIIEFKKIVVVEMLKLNVEVDVFRDDEVPRIDYFSAVNSQTFNKSILSLVKNSLTENNGKTIAVFEYAVYNPLPAKFIFLNIVWPSNDFIFCGVSFLKQENVANSGNVTEYVSNGQRYTPHPQILKESFGDYGYIQVDQKVSWTIEFGTLYSFTALRLTFLSLMSSGHDFPNVTYSNNESSSIFQTTRSAHKFIEVVQKCVGDMACFAVEYPIKLTSKFVILNITGPLHNLLVYRIGLLTLKQITMDDEMDIQNNWVYSNNRQWSYRGELEYEKDCRKNRYSRKAIRSITLDKTYTIEVVELKFHEFDDKSLPGLKYFSSSDANSLNNNNKSLDFIQRSYEIIKGERYTVLRYAIINPSQSNFIFVEIEWSHHFCGISLYTSLTIPDEWCDSRKDPDVKYLLYDDRCYSVFGHKFSSNWSSARDRCHNYPKTNSSLAKFKTGAKSSYFYIYRSLKRSNFTSGHYWIMGSERSSDCSYLYVGYLIYLIHFNGYCNSSKRRICEYDIPFCGTPDQNNSTLMTYDRKRADYSCPKGFHLVGASVRHCFSGTWSPEAPFCRRSVENLVCLSSVNATVSTSCDSELHDNAVQYIIKITVITVAVILIVQWIITGLIVLYLKKY